MLLTKKNQISCTGSKVPFWQFFNFAKMELLNTCMKFITCPRIYAEKSTKRGFSKKALVRIEKLFFLGSYESLKGLER